MIQWSFVILFYHKRAALGIDMDSKPYSKEGYFDNFLDKNNVSDMYLGLLYPVTNFYIWFGTAINQENQFQSIPPYIMALHGS